MTAPVASLSEERLTIPSDVLGPVVVSSNEVFRFPQGLYGFPECRNFVLLPTPREGAFWLQSADFATLSFVLIDPFAYFPSYQIDLDDNDVTRLGTRETEQMLVLAIVTMAVEPDAPCTANLHAPILFNLRDRHAHQSIRADDTYSFREPFFIECPAESATARA